MTDIPLPSKEQLADEWLRKFGDSQLTGTTKLAVRQFAQWLDKRPAPEPPQPGAKESIRPPADFYLSDELLSKYAKIGYGVNAMTIYNDVIRMACELLERRAHETKALLTHSPEPSAYLKLWDNSGPCCRVDLKADCEPWLEALNPIVTPLYARLQTPLKANGDAP